MKVSSEVPLGDGRDFRLPGSGQPGNEQGEAVLNHFAKRSQKGCCQQRCRYFQRGQIQHPETGLNSLLELYLGAGCFEVEALKAALAQIDLDILDVPPVTEGPVAVEEGHFITDFAPSRVAVQVALNDIFAQHLNRGSEMVTTTGINHGLATVVVQRPVEACELRHGNFHLREELTGLMHALNQKLLCLFCPIVAGQFLYNGA